MKNKAFTLIELLVVVLIIGILAAIALPKYEKAVKKTHVAKMLPALRAVWTAERAARLETTNPSLNSLGIDIPKQNMPGWTTTNNAITGSNFISCTELKPSVCDDIGMVALFQFMKGDAYMWIGVQSDANNQNPEFICQMWHSTETCQDYGFSSKTTTEAVENIILPSGTYYLWQ